MSWYIALGALYAMIGIFMAGVMSDRHSDDSLFMPTIITIFWPLVLLVDCIVHIYQLGERFS